MSTTTQHAKVKARIFKVDCNDANATDVKGSPKFIEILRKCLKGDSPAQNRRMKLNDTSPDEDLLASYSWNTSKTSLFGLMMRLVPDASTGAVPPELFQRLQISIADLQDSGDAGRSLCTSHYYFMLDESHLITTLPGQQSIENFQTYANWLTQAERPSLVSFLPEIELPQELKIGNIKRIEVGENAKIISRLESPSSCLSNALRDLKTRVLKLILKDENTDANAPDDVADCVAAKLVISTGRKKKHKEIPDDKFANAMALLLKPVDSDSGIVIYGENDQRLSGADAKMTRVYCVEKTSNNCINIEQLKQKFEEELRGLE